MFNSNWSKRARSLRHAWLIPLLLIPAVAGCAKDEPPDEPVTITFGYDGSEEYYQALVEAFNETYPYITVELDIDDDEVPPDVLTISPFDLSDLLEENAILAVDPFVEQDESFDLTDFYPGTVELCSREGRLWAIPSEANMFVIYYNQDLFDQYGVAYPEAGWTWDDFLDIALALRDEDDKVFGYSILNEFLEPLPFIYQHGGRILDDMQNPTRTTFDDPLTIEAMEWLVELIYEYDVIPSQRQIFDVGGSTESGVYRNQIGMWMDFLSARGGGQSLEETWPGEWKFRWEMVPLPSDAQAATPTFVLGYAISAEAGSPDACWKWITFLSQQMQTPFGMTPARRSLTESTEYAQLVGDDIAEIARGAMENALLLSPSLVEFVPPFIYFQATSRIINGTLTPYEALTGAQEQAERSLE